MHCKGFRLKIQAKIHFISIVIPQNRKPRFGQQPRFWQQKCADQRVVEIGVLLYTVIGKRNLIRRNGCLCGFWNNFFAG